jgi:dTMP kinase
MHREKGKVFITVEGIHGAGKSALISRLVWKLRELNLNVVLVTDQACTAIGKELRRINLQADLGVPSVLTEALLIAAARHQNVVEIIKPSLISGTVVLGERFNDAFFAFQGYGRGLPFDLLCCLSKAVADGIEPDITFLLDLDPEIAFTRIKGHLEHRIEKEPITFHKKVREGYLAQARENPNRIIVLNASASADIIFQEAWAKIEKVIKGGTDI